MPAYSSKAQPFLDAIATGVYSSQAVRDWLLSGTFVEPDYRGSLALNEEQRSVRWKGRQTKQPFWANYFCGRDSGCECRIEGSKGLESDAIFFLENSRKRVLAIHVEFKHSREAFGYGQPECYPLRAACFLSTYRERPTLNAHDDWITVLFCGSETMRDPRISHFQRVITHQQAVNMLASYPR